MANKIVMKMSEVTELPYEKFKENVNALRDAVGQLIQREEDRGELGDSMIVMAGSIGLWDGTRMGGKHVSLDNMFNTANYDDGTVYLNDNNELEIKLYHHDGVHQMNYYLVSEKLADEMGLDWDEDQWSGEDYQRVIKECVKLKADKYFEGELGWELEEE